MMVVFLCIMSVLGVQGSEESDEIEYLETEKRFMRFNRVLVCLNQDARNQLIIQTCVTDLSPQLLSQFPDLNIEYHDVNSCYVEIDKDHAQPRTVIAVIAPKPFKLSSNIPMYFYDTPYLEVEDIDAFPHAITAVQNHWKLLKQAFIHYIKRHQWERIGIVSDYSSYSAAFEMQLVEQFKEKDLVYAVQRCVVTENSTCDFKEALNFFKENEAVIIIVNIDSSNAQNLSDAASDMNVDMKSSEYLWLVRDWPFKDTTSQNFSNIISITMSAIAWPSCNGDRYDHEGPHLNSIQRGLYILSDAVKSLKKRESIENNFRSLIKNMRNTNCDKAKAFIRKFTRGRPVPINSLVVYDSGFIKPNSDYQFKSDIKIDDLKFCLLRTKSFTNSCSDFSTVLICVVWLMFILMVFMLIFFFKNAFCGRRGGL